MASIVALAAGHVAASERIPVQDARALMIAAIDSPSGEARGVLVGLFAQAIGQGFQTAAPVTIDVTTEKRFAQPGCSRLKVLFAQDGVVLPGKKAPERKTVEFGINYCRDGSAPKAM